VKYLLVKSIGFNQIKAEGFRFYSVLFLFHTLFSFNQKLVTKQWGLTSHLAEDIFAVNDFKIPDQEIKQVLQNSDARINKNSTTDYH